MKTRNITIIALALACLTFGTFTIAHAGDHGWDDDDGRRKDRAKTIGEISSIDPDKSLIEVTDQNGKITVFKISPVTELEFEDNGMLSWGDDAVFADLENGQWVKIKYHPSEGIKAATEIDIYRVKSR